MASRVGSFTFIGVKTPWKKPKQTSSASSDAPATSDDASTSAAEASTATQADSARNEDHGEHVRKGSAYTPKKGRPTPKRNEIERQHGVRKTAYAGPETPAEARKRRKEMKKQMGREEYKAMRQRERDKANRERRIANERMMRGEEEYLLERDRGPVRRFIRDYVDSRRFLMNLFLPLTLIVVIIMIVGLRYPAISNLTSIVMMVVFLIMVGEGFWLSRKLNKVINERFPDNPHSKWSVGMYAFTRATMIRRLRTPAPQKQIGDKVGTER